MGLLHSFRLGNYRDQSPESEALCAALERFDPRIMWNQNWHSDWVTMRKTIIDKVNTLIKKERDRCGSTMDKNLTPEIGGISFDYSRDHYLPASSSVVR